MNTESSALVEFGANSIDELNLIWVLFWSIQAIPVLILGVWEFLIDASV